MAFRFSRDQSTQKYTPLKIEPLIYTSQSVINRTESGLSAPAHVISLKRISMEQILFVVYNNENGCMRRRRITCNRITCSPKISFRFLQYFVVTVTRKIIQFCQFYDMQEIEVH